MSGSIYGSLPFLFISACPLIVYFLFISSAQFSEIPSLTVLISLTTFLPAEDYSQIDFQRKDDCALIPTLGYLFVPCHMINNRGEVGGSVQLNRLKALMVSFENALHAVTVRVLSVAILGKTKGEWYKNYSQSEWNTVEIGVTIVWCEQQHSSCTTRCSGLKPTVASCWKWKQVVNRSLTYHHFISWYGEPSSIQLLIQASSSYQATLTFFWNQSSVHLMNVISSIHSLLALGYISNFWGKCCIWPSNIFLLKCAWKHILMGRAAFRGFCDPDSLNSQAAMKRYSPLKFLRKSKPKREGQSYGVNQCVSVLLVYYSSHSNASS